MARPETLPAQVTMPRYQPAPYSRVPRPAGFRAASEALMARMDPNSLLAQELPLLDP